MRKNFTLFVSLLFVLLLSVPDRLMAQINCVTPTNLTTTNISPTGAVLYLGTTSATGMYNIRYHGPNSTTWITLNNVTVPYQLGNLTCGTAYEWQAQQVCGTTPNNVSVLSDWSAGAAFTTGACTAPVCPVPTNLSATNITQTGAVLSLGANTVAGTYNIRYHGPNATNWITVNNVALPFQLGNLTCNTSYEWQVQKICANSAGTTGALSDWSVGAAFTTGACPQPSPCPVPTNLTATNISQNGAVLHFGTTATSGRYNIRYHGPNSTTWITVNNVTVPFQLGNLACGTAYEWQAQQICTITGAQNYNFSDWSVGAAFTTLPCSTPTDCPVPTYLSTTNISQTGAVLNLGTIANTGTFNIRYHSANSAAWITINNVTMPYQLGNLTCHTGYEWQAQKVCSNADGSATVLSAWSVGSAFTTSACPTPDCPVPTNLTSTNISPNGAVLSLGANTPAGIYNIRYHGPNSVNWITVNNVAMPYQLGNLMCNTTYEWQVQQVCANSGTTTGALSAWSAGAAFTTLACPAPTCPVPTNLSATNITQTGAVLSLGANTAAGLYNIRYHGPNSTNWITINNVTMPYQLSGLMCHTTYEWQAQQVCANSGTTAGVLSAWSTGVAFTTAACPVTNCSVPTNLTATNITQTGAVLSLGANTAAGMYNIRYRASNSTVLITINNVTMPFQLGGLTCHTTYEWQAQQICATSPGAAPILSDWSAGATFITAECPVNCPVPTYLSTTNISQNAAVLNLGSIANTGTFNIRYHGPNSATWIMINNVTMPYQLGNLNCNTAYEWQAQKVCAPSTGTNNNLSPWSAGVAFTTTACSQPTCPIPTNLMTTNISQNGAVLHFGTTATAGRYNIRYHGPNSATWITLNNVTVPFQLRELMCHTAYEWQAQRICGNADGTVNGLSPWSAGAVFTTTACSTTPTCPIPTGLLATNISQSGALLHWNAVAGVTSYIVRYRPANSDVAFITATSVTNSIQIGNLTLGTVYVWQVSAVCANGTVAGINWSPQAMFTTRASLAAYPNPANQSTSISYWSDRIKTVDVKILDLYGKEVFIEKRDAIEGYNVFGINTSGVADGLYLIGVYSDDVLTTSKVIIKH